MSSTEIESEIELYDSDRLTLDAVRRRLQEYVGKNRATTTEAFVREIKERFEDSGFIVDVRLFSDQAEDHLPEEERHWYTKIVLVGRIEKQGEFDHEQMGHEVRSNMLGVNQQGDVQKKTVGQTGFSQTSSGLIVPN